MSEEKLRAALVRVVKILDNLYDAGPECDCTMDGAVHTCGWPELRRAREQAHKALEPLPNNPS